VLSSSGGSGVGGSANGISSVCASPPVQYGPPRGLGPPGPRSQRGQLTRDDDRTTILSSLARHSVIVYTDNPRRAIPRAAPCPPTRPTPAMVSSRGPTTNGATNARVRPLRAGRSRPRMGPRMHECGRAGRAGKGRPRMGLRMHECGRAWRAGADHEWGHECTNTRATLGYSCIRVGFVVGPRRPVAPFALAGDACPSGQMPRKHMHPRSWGPCARGGTGAPAAPP
jgi:hypothetical protein